MRTPRTYLRYLPALIVALVAVAALAAAIRQRLLPGGGDLPTLTLVVTIAAGAGIAALLLFRRAARTATLVAATDDLVGAPEPRDADDLARWNNSLRKLHTLLRARSDSRAEVRQIFDSMIDPLFVTDTDGLIQFANGAAHAMLGCQTGELAGRRLPDLAAPASTAAFDSAVNNALPAEATLRAQDQREIPVSYSVSRIDPEVFSHDGFIVIARNISERKITEQRIRYLAKIDALTKIPNRMQFQHLLQQQIARAQKQNRVVALLYFDVDRFKDINDTYGHSAGDACLESLASRLTRIMPPGAFSGRLAGDEFAIAVDWDRPKAELSAFLQSFAKRLRTDLSQPLIVHGHEIHIGISIGIACYPRDADNVIDLIRNADSALYHAKRDPRTSFEFFDAQMNAASVERLMLKSKLRRSFELDELLIHYQPKIDVKTGAVVGAEALVRWELTDRGMILPSEFIPLAEETNLIVPIGEWVLNQVCKDVADWQHRLSNTGRISVNLSLKQLAQPNFTKRMQRIMDRHGVSPRALELEITETTLMRDPDHTIPILKQLNNLGLNLSIDDFGTGYSSLSALQQFPTNTLKIDQSFIHDILVNKDGTTIVAAIIDLAHSMKMDVVAEGVESELQLSYLKVLNCDVVQGLLFGEPMAASDYFELLLTDHRGHTSHRALFA